MQVTKFRASSKYPRVSKAGSIDDAGRCRGLGKESEIMIKGIRRRGDLVTIIIGKSQFQDRIEITKTIK